MRIDGKSMEQDKAAVKSKLGVVFQNSVLDKALTVFDNLCSRAALYGITGTAFRKRLDALDGLLELKPLLRRPVGKLSGGQRRRADIARALLHEPSILILDEPTTGLDPQTRAVVWQVITRLRKEQGMTVLLTTHYMEEAADADAVLIIDAGRRVASGTPLELKNAYTGDFITLYGADEEQIRRLNTPYEVLRGAYRIEVPSTAAATALILAHPEVFVDYEITKGRMDDVFLAATARKPGRNRCENIVCLHQAQRKALFSRQGYVFYLSDHAADPACSFFHLSRKRLPRHVSLLRTTRVRVPDTLIDGFVGGWLLSSLLAVCCVTVAFCSNMQMVQDKVSGAEADLAVTPVKRSTLAVGYYLSAALTTLLICGVALCVGFLYLWNAGWYLSLSDVLLTVLDVFLLVCSAQRCHRLINRLLVHAGTGSQPLARSSVRLTVSSAVHICRSPSRNRPSYRYLLFCRAPTARR